VTVAAGTISAAKIAISGGFGAGKTTFIGAISEVLPLTTESIMTVAAAGTDPAASGKTATTVAMDFGRITLDGDLVMYLFGTPGQDRFGFMWDYMVRGALGALVVVDSSRLDDCFQAVDYFERAGLPFAVAVNEFNGHTTHDLTEVRWALAVSDRVPIATFDARKRTSVRDALMMVLEQALDKAAAQAGAA
jgi:signal recognition particle receptor subunit beta